MTARVEAPQAPAVSPRRGEAKQLGVALCWAVVFADIGTSVYYTPGILFHQVGVHAALFVSMTLAVFVLLAIKYAEVAVRYPEGGGVVTVASVAIGPLAGLVGGLFILVDYFLTIALSALSGLIYLSVVAPNLKPVVLPATLIALALLAVLNIVGISASARASAVFAVIALASQLAVVTTVILHVGVPHLLDTFPEMVKGKPHLGPVRVITGYAGAFLAFSGLESMSQLSPAMRDPRSRVAPRAMTAVVVTVALTSPLLTLWSTTLLDASKNDPNQFVSLLGGFAAGQWLQWEVAISGAALLVFASNTAIIGSYHVFLALSRGGFLPTMLQRTNRWRGTPHYAILIAVGVPLLVLIAAHGNVDLLGDLYAFGLLGAFVVTCISLDLVRWRERVMGRSGVSLPNVPDEGLVTRFYRRWTVGTTLLFGVGVLTTGLVSIAWLTNLVAKPHATLFGGGVTVLGLIIAMVTWRIRDRKQPIVFPHRHGHTPVFLSGLRKGRQTAVLAIVPRDAAQIEPLVRTAEEEAHGRPIVFLYRGDKRNERPKELLEIVDPYLADDWAHKILGDTERLAGKRSSKRAYVYLPSNAGPRAVARHWNALHPEETVATVRDRDLVRDIPEGDVRLIG